MASPALLTAQNCYGHIHLILGSGPLAASRCVKSFEVGAKPVVVAPAESDIHFTLAKLVEDKKVLWIRRDFEDTDLQRLGREEVDYFVDAVFLTNTKDPDNEHVSQLCKRRRIPVNAVDSPNLCTFTLLSTHSDGPLQIGITTSGRGCKLASRIRREIASNLPPKLGDAVDRLGMMRKRIWEEDLRVHNAELPEGQPEAEDEEAANQKHTFNNLVKESDKSPEVNRTRRMRWLSQICEYWPLGRLTAITDEDVSAILAAYASTASLPAVGKGSPTQESVHVLSKSQPRKGTITLAGSGPGHPSLLTLATHSAIKTSDYILADKLVPADILALIPRRTPVHIARKFPGNADAAQQELLELSLAALKEGKKVLRLKQGDPYLYGRGAEEVMFIRDRGFDVKVIPGVTSALSAPMFAGIPVTHRAVADEVVICTGTGRKGAAPQPPVYKKSKTVVFLMALHRLENLINTLILGASETSVKENHALWPRDTPCAIVERASCPDQRVVRSTLENICQAFEEEGSRPPGLLVVGSACEVLHKPAPDRKWLVEEGFRMLDNTEFDLRGLDSLHSLQISTKGSAKEESVCNVSPRYANPEPFT